MADDYLFSLLDQIYPILCIGLGSYVIYVFFRMTQQGNGKSSYVLPLGIYLVFWHSWLNLRFNMLPESLQNSMLGISYWALHDAMLFVCMGLALVPLLAKPVLQNVELERVYLPEHEPADDETAADTLHY